MVYLQQAREGGSLTANIPKKIVDLLGLIKGSNIAFVPIDGKPDSVEMRVIR